ncbi:MAG: hypothetical protein Q9187_005455 [Circinaria calcarea]
MQPYDGNGNKNNNLDYQQNGSSNYQQSPPVYGSGPQYGDVVSPLAGGKQTFDQAFKLEKPKYNDIWAGILLILTFLGFTAVSGITLNGYATNKSFNGGGIYNAGNEFSLNTNTIVLFAFVLVVALVFSWLYFAMARAFTKQFMYVPIPIA